MSAGKTVSTMFSKMEATFVASSTLKRNRRYLDIERLNQDEEHEHLKRRRPRNNSKSVQAKINRSFSNSTAALTERLGRDISKFKSRFNSQQRPRTAQSFYELGSATVPITKGVVGMSHHLSREDYYKVRSKPVLDQRLFNNFKLEGADTVHMADLGRGPQREFDNSLKHINDIEYNTQKLYQQYYYKRNNMDCRFNYKKQHEEERYFFRPKREENKPATDLSPKAVKKSADAVAIKQPIDSFYMNSGRELPCQLQQRTGTNLTSHWRNSSDLIDRPHPEYSVRAMKQQLKEQRRDKISASKRANFARGQVCDRKFFIMQGQSC